MSRNSGIDFMTMFGFFMVLLYIGLGFYILFAPYFDAIQPQVVRLVFALFFIAYGVFRFVRIYFKVKNRRDREILDEKYENLKKNNPS